MEATKEIDYSKLLKTGQSAASEDQKLFYKYAMNKISLKECYDAFIRNCLGRHTDAYWDPIAFKKWLRGLGYFNRKDIVIYNGK